jgi:HEAT repeat protein
LPTEAAHVGRESKIIWSFRRFILVVILLSGFSGIARAQSTSAVLTRLQNQINQGSIEEKRSALSEIRNLRSESASRIALPALRDKDAMVRATAAGSVIFLPRSEAAGALLPLLDDRSEFVRTETAYALGNVGDRSATSQLARLMRDDKILEVRTASAVAIGQVGDTAAISELVAILKARPTEDHEFLRRSAARSIGQIAQINVTGDPTVLTPQNFLPDKFKDLGSSDATGAVPQIYANAVEMLTTVLRNKNETDDTRREAAFSLGAIGDARSLDVLRTYATSPDPYLAEICKEAILKIERRAKTNS